MGGGHFRRDYTRREGEGEKFESVKDLCSFPHERVDKLHCLLDVFGLTCGPVDSLVSSPSIQGCFVVSGANQHLDLPTNLSKVE